MALDSLLYWRHKDDQHNLWRPVPGQSATLYRDNLPNIVKRMDVEATVVDAAPFITVVGAATHVSQLHSFGFTTSASLFKNVKTLTALHRATLFVTPVVLACQAAGFNYRAYIPRWAHAREVQRDEEIVRQHIDAGMALGAASWLLRLSFKLGARYWAPIDILAGGALADVMQREYLRAHAF
ncbi:uncharacterized protein K489DRAFT_310628 [Dissoconium aciculare CBS 342.82]|uniref:Uncharacterized protein n=1 Tax=Dissoconium aciculare CBS 342.82 TaxID=1314786 RepID=A0A6J3MJP2_9PEZI|nr:uncharacterized protein K489DRAFT_310628 [Dissoconium aciculare CBS 342.82]KAF1827157.1 hypothetical protein K489DRAFT_310628 [Dissoconium aciculare CBS 342.82]